MRISDWSSDVCSSDLQLFRFITPNAGVGEAYRRPPAKVKRLLLVEETVFEAPQLRAIGLDGEMEALRIGKAIGLLSRLGGIDLNVGQHGRCPSKAGSIRGPQKNHQRGVVFGGPSRMRSEEHTSELQSLMRISYAVFCLKKKKQNRKI